MPIPPTASGSTDLPGLLGLDPATLAAGIDPAVLRSLLDVVQSNL